MQKNPHQLIEGMIIGAYAAGANRAFIFIRGEYELQADILEAARRAGPRGGLPGRAHPGLRPHHVAGPAPRRRRLHLRRGDGAAGLAGGQARQPAPQAAVPRQPGPLPGAHAGQQRRDAVHRPPHHRAWAARSTPSSAPRARPGPRSSRCRAACSGPGNYEIELGIPSREIVYGLAGGPPEGREVKCWFPGGSSAPVLTDEHLDLPYDFDSMAKAGSMLGSGSIIVVDDSIPVIDVARGWPSSTPRVVRQVHAVPGGHQLDGEDARAHGQGRGHADGPGDPGRGAGADHRQLPVRAGRLDGHADRLDGQALPRGVRGPHRAGARAATGTVEALAEPPR